MAVALEDLDAAGTLAAVESALVARRSAEVRDLELVARWADLHAADPRFAPDRKHSLEGWDRLVRVGGPGTPLVQELCICELAVSREVHSLSTRSAMADVLDLRHRLPRVWAVVRGLRAEVWVARRVAVMSRELDCDAVGLVEANLVRSVLDQNDQIILPGWAALGTSSPNREPWAHIAVPPPPEVVV